MVVDVLNTGILAGFGGCEVAIAMHPLRMAHFNSYFRGNAIA
ncbi:hypothetical protein [Nostoc sp. KVJ3]|nr:hypothetical protein [Nostoc sp. KVJ3]